jgi:hypothetical protein
MAVVKIPKLIFAAAVFAAAMGLNMPAGPGPQAAAPVAHRNHRKQHAQR